MDNITESFLGVNCESGFFSLYEDFISRRKRVYVIKGGPGTGKSTLMRRVAQEAASRGRAAELLHCSSDPSSLDAVLIKDSGVCIVDGTPPHIVEPPLPGAVGRIVDLYRFWDNAALEGQTAQIKEHNKKTGALFSRAWLYLGAAGRLQRDLAGVGASLADRPKLRGYTERLCARLIRPLRAAPSEEKRFFAAITPAGRVFYDPAEFWPEHRQLVFEDEYGIASRVLEAVRARARACGQRVICGFSPLIPEQLTHLVLPDAALTLCVSNTMHSTQPKPYCRVNISRFIDVTREGQMKAKLGFLIRSRDEIIREACDLLQQCRSEHDALEKRYRAAVDFRALDMFTREFIEEILG